MSAPNQQFRDAIQAAGLSPPDVIESDGKLRRFASNGKHGDDAGWYLMYGDGIPAGSFGDWRTGLAQTWRADIGRTPTPAEEAAHLARIERARREREADDAARKTAAASNALSIWNAAKPVTSHPYLSRKQVKAYGLRVKDDRLIVPMRDGGEIHSLQFIDADGEKRFLTGGRVKGSYHSIGKPDRVLCVCEGFATGATIHEATGHAVAVAFNAGNLEPVTMALRAKFPALQLIVCADDDAQTPGNPGLSKATAAAKSAGALLAIPDFGANRPEGASDLNDLGALLGLDAVKQAIARAIEPSRENAPDDDSGWQEPQPLAAKVEPELYPLDALPDTVRAAVEEVAGFVKAPVAMVASSALAALSLAIQAHADGSGRKNCMGLSRCFC